MGFLINLAFKNLLRYRRRTIITSVAIAAGLGIFIWIDAFMLGIEVDSQRNLIYYETGSAQIMKREYFEEREYLPLKHTITDPDKLTDTLVKANIPATKRIAFGGELFLNAGSQQVLFYGIDLKTYGKIFKTEEDIEEGGRFLTPGKAEIILGKKVAEYLGARVTDFVEIRTRTRYGTSQTFELEVVGIVNSPNPTVNMGIGYLSLETAAEALDMNGTVTDIVLLIPEWKNLDKELELLGRRLSTVMDGLELHSWKEVNIGMMMMEQKKKFIYVMLFLVFIIAAVGITNTMLMAVFERIREIGMMRALGMKDNDIRKSFLLEAAGIGIIGSTIGLAMGAALTFLSVQWGLDYSAFLGDMDLGIRITGVFRAAWNPPTMIVAFVFGIIAAVVVSFIPSSRALKMEITECLRHQ